MTLFMVWRHIQGGRLLRSWRCENVDTKLSTVWCPEESGSSCCELPLGAESPGEKSLRGTGGRGLRVQNKGQVPAWFMLWRESVEDLCRIEVSCENPEIQRSECWRRAETGREKGGGHVWNLPDGEGGSALGQNRHPQTTVGSALSLRGSDVWTAGGPRLPTIKPAGFSTRWIRNVSSDFGQREVRWNVPSHQEWGSRGSGPLHRPSSPCLESLPRMPETTGCQWGCKEAALWPEWWFWTGELCSVLWMSWCQASPVAGQVDRRSLPRSQQDTMRGWIKAVTTGMWRREARKKDIARLEG